ncbi:GNAT family N-acetyltransferase [Shewanella sp. FJAT-52076]|nr:GNAT family N-acetyltransferase [Shewanella sp. FJAT-52076]
MSQSIDTDIAPVTKADLEAVMQLVLEVAQQDVLPLFSQEGQETFLNRVLPDVETTFDSSKFIALKACQGSKLVGFAALRDGNFLTHLFVDKSVQGSGLGKTLLSTLLGRTEANEVNLCSSVNAVGFYQHLGFSPTGPQAQKNGVRFVPMRIKR